MVQVRYAIRHQPCAFRYGQKRWHASAGSVDFHTSIDLCLWFLKVKPGKGCHRCAIIFCWTHGEKAEERLPIIYRLATDDIHRSYFHIFHRLWKRKRGFPLIRGTNDHLSTSKWTMAQCIALVMMSSDAAIFEHHKQLYIYALETSADEVCQRGFRDGTPTLPISFFVFFS